MLAMSHSTHYLQLHADSLSAVQLKERSEAASVQEASHLQQAAALGNRAADLISRQLDFAAVHTPDIEEHSRQRAAGVVNHPLKVKVFSRGIMHLSFSILCACTGGGRHAASHHVVPMHAWCRHCSAVF